MLNAVAVIPARGGSIGIPKKNVVEFCGKPLVAWSILQASRARSISSVWVSSDSDEILKISEQYGARGIKRPSHLSTNEASSESVWLHALDEIQSRNAGVDVIIGMQSTSPLRETSDLENALIKFEKEDLDSLFSCCEIEDFFIWKQEGDKNPVSVNYDFRNRHRRQELEKRFLENGSFYLFKPEILRKQRNRLGGKIGFYVMADYKMFQIDRPEDLRLCEIIMKGYGLSNG